MKRISVQTFLERHVETAPPAGYIFHGQIFPPMGAEADMKQAPLRPYTLSPARLACMGLAGVCSYAAQVPARVMRVISEDAVVPDVQSQTILWDANLREQLIAACGRRSPLVQAVLCASTQAARGPDIWSVRPHYTSPASTIGITAYKGERCLGVAVYEGEPVPEHALLFEAFWHGIYTRSATRTCTVPAQPTGSKEVYRPTVTVRP